MRKAAKAQDKAKQPKKGEEQVPTVPVWVIQPHVYQQLILKWFETMHEDFKELGSILERIEAKMNEE